MFKQQLTKTIVGLLTIAILGTSCADNYEKIRRSNSVKEKMASAFKYYQKGECDKAQFLFEDILPLVKGDTIGEKVYFTYANSHFCQKNYNFASYYFKQFFITYPNSDLAEEALYMAAYSNYMLSPTYRLDQTYTEKAIEGMQLFANTYPQSKRISECNKLVDQMRRVQEEKAYESANLYFRMKDYKSAVYSFQSLLQDYPDTENTEKISYMIILSNYHLALNSILSKEIERLNETIKFYQNFVDTYPKSKYLTEAQEIFSSCVTILEKIKKASERK